MSLTLQLLETRRFLPKQRLQQGRSSSHPWRRVRPFSLSLYFLSQNSLTYSPRLDIRHLNRGYARLAIDVYQKLFDHNKLCLCTSDSKSSPSDYGLQKEQFLLVGKDDLGKSLRSMGSARAVICEFRTLFLLFGLAFSR